MAKQIAFFFDASACTGCKGCQVACKEKNDNPIGVNYRRVLSIVGGSWNPHNIYKNILVPNNIFAYSVSVACMHCQKPICVEVCPTGAMDKNTDGIVSVDKNKCIGCRLCQQSCPYGAPQFNEELGIMTKCNLCEDLIAIGEKPACVDACPMRALDIGELSELQAKYGTLDGIEPLPDPILTQPAVVITPHRHSVLSGQGTGKIKMEV
jgi:anaerobic dimethyl sulfoxide reductase subunit B (iron-sulfur subunit)